MWIQGTIGDYDFYIKYYDEPSRFGISEGRISKLEIRKDGKTLANYDRGWDIEPTAEIIEVYNELLAKYN